MHKVHLNGADAEAIADIMGGTLIMVDETNDEATIAGGDPSKLLLEPVCDECGQVHELDDITA